MAARRLIIVMVILFGVSAVLASQAPRRDENAEEDTQSTAPAEGTGTEQAATPPGPAGATGGEQAGATVTGAPAGEPNILCGDATCAEIGVDRTQISVIPVELGDSFALIVTSRGTTDLVEIPGLGLIDSVTPFKDATFRFVADTAGDYGIKLVESDRLIGRIEVRPPPKTKKKAPAKPR